VVLGDDIVIFDSSVAKRYYYIMNTLLEVKIGLAKSIVSRKSLTLEFAKKYYVDGEAANMVPLRDIITASISTSTMNEFMLKHKWSFQMYLRLRGLGYKTRSKLQARL
jgi:hypothetical protein